MENALFMGFSGLFIFNIILRSQKYAMGDLCQMREVQRSVLSEFGANLMLIGAYRFQASPGAHKKRNRIDVKLYRFFFPPYFLTVYNYKRSFTTRVLFILSKLVTFGIRSAVIYFPIDRYFKIPPPYFASL